MAKNSKHRSGPSLPPVHAGAPDRAASPVSREEAPANLVRPVFGRRSRALPPKTHARAVLLQGPVGPFFKHLQHGLEQSGFDCWRLTFNAGDRLYSGRKKRIAYEGGIEEWRAWFRGFLVVAEPDVLVLFGVERQVHAVARALAAERAIPVLCLEEGYIRPGFITAEFGGNNRLSPIAGMLPPPSFKEPAEPAENAYNGFAVMCLHGAAYYGTRTVFTGHAARSAFHRPINPLRDIYCWTRNAVRRVTDGAPNAAAIGNLLEHHAGRYFLVPLQVSDDLQLKDAALGWTNARLIMETMKSFARAAPADHRLVIKIHPLERGHSQDHELIAEIATMLGIKDRIDVLDSGSLGLLTHHCAGMITINSTSGLSAIFHGVPLLVVGEALYGHPDLATCAQGMPDFDAFWPGGHVAPANLRRRYLSWVRHKCLMPGDFYDQGGRKIAVRAICDMLADRKYRVARLPRGDNPAQRAI